LFFVCLVDWLIGWLVVVVLLYLFAVQLLTFLFLPSLFISLGVYILSLAFLFSARVLLL